MMATLPLEKRAICLPLRRAEETGVIAAPCELRELVDGFPYPQAEIDRCLDLLVSPEGRTVGGTLDLDELAGEWVGRLVIADLIEMNDGGDLELSEKGQMLSLLLDEYADPNYVLRPLATNEPDRRITCPREVGS